MENKEQEQEPEVLHYKLKNGQSVEDFMYANFGDRVSAEEFDATDGETFVINFDKE